MKDNKTLKNSMDTITIFEHTFRTENGYQLKMRAEFYKKRENQFEFGNIYLRGKMKHLSWKESTNLSIEYTKISLMKGFLVHVYKMFGSDFPLQETLQEWIDLLPKEGSYG